MNTYQYNPRPEFPSEPPTGIYEYNGGPAFPASPEHGLNTGLPGMTLRDYFAIHEPISPVDTISRVLAEQLTGKKLPHPSEDVDYTHLKAAVFWADAEALYRYMRADAMLRAREAASPKGGEA